MTSREADTQSAEDLTGDVLAGALAARAAAEEAGDRYRALVESAPDGIVEVDGRGRIVLVNHETRRLFGYGGDELIGQSVGILIPERFREAHIQHEAKYARAPGLRAMGSGLELVGRRKDGTEFPVEISLSPQRMDGAAFVMAIVRDISERKRAEAALRESDERFRLIVDDVKDYGIFMLDPDGYLLSWNAGAELITGYAAEECQGWHCSAFYPATPSSAVHLRMSWRSRRRKAGPRWRGCACARMVRSTSRASSRRRCATSAASSGASAGCCATSPSSGGCRTNANVCGWRRRQSVSAHASAWTCTTASSSRSTRSD